MIIDGFNISESGGTSGVSTVSVSASRNEDFVAKTTAIEVDSAVGNIKRVINLTQSAAVGYEYTPINYIWNRNLSTGEIDLGYVPGDNTVIEMDVEPEYTTNSNRKILWFDSFLYYAYQNYQYFALGGSAYTLKTNLNRSVISLSHTVGGWSWSGVTDTVKVYGMDGRAKIYGIKIYEDNVLVRDYVPALDSNGVVCLFDKVNFEYYYFKVNGEISSSLTSGGYIGSTSDYLQGAGDTADYIDLNYIPSATTSIEVEVEGGYGNILGAFQYKSSVWTRFGIAGYMNNNGQSTVIGNFAYVEDHNNVSLTGTTSDRNVLKMTPTGGTQNGDTIATYSHTWRQGQESITVFGYRVKMSSSYTNQTPYYNGKIYYVKIWENDTLVRDLIPFSKDNKVGLYDKLSGTFYPSVKTTITQGGTVAPYKERVVYDESAVTISNSDISTVYVGDTVSLNASTTPTGVTLSYSSSDSGVCTVDSSGVISGVSEGNAVITITSGELRDDANQVHYYPVKKKVNVNVSGYTLSSVTISNSDLSTLAVGSTFNLNTATEPTGATLSYSSSNNSIAKVGADGVVSGRSAGSTTITITAGDVIDTVNHIYYQGTSKQVSVSVYDIVSLSTENPRLNFHFGSIDCTATPSANQKTIDFYCHNETGSSDYGAPSLSGLYVNTIEPLSNLVIKVPGSVQHNSDPVLPEPYDINFGLNPSHLPTYILTLPSADYADEVQVSSISEPTASGDVSLTFNNVPEGEWYLVLYLGKDNGDGNIYMENRNGPLEFSVIADQATKYDNISAMTLSSSEPSGPMAVGDTFSLNASTDPTGATLVYSTSDSGVCSVDSSGVISGVSAGSCTITITALGFFDTVNNVYYRSTSKTINVTIPAWDEDFLTLTALEDTDISVAATGSTSQTPVLNLYYKRTGDSDYTQLPVTVANSKATYGTISLQQGQSVKIYGNSNWNKGQAGNRNYYNRFTSTGKFNASGKVSSVLSSGCTDSVTSSNNNYMFRGMFRESNIVDASGIILPSNVINTQGVFWGMFQLCPDLTTLPSVLPEVQATLQYAFFCNQSPSLTSVSVTFNGAIDGATGLSGMFQQCTGLTTVVINSVSETYPNGYIYGDSLTGVFQNCPVLTSVTLNAKSAHFTSMSPSPFDGVTTTGTLYAPTDRNWSNVSYLGLPATWSIQDIPE